MNIWIIGASHGIGASLAEKLSNEGHNLAISARSHNQLQVVLNSLKPADHILLPLDVTDFTLVKKSFALIMEKWGRIDLFIYGSAIYKPMKSTAIDVDLAMKTMQVNFNSLIYFLSLIIPQMIKQKSGHIAMISSVAGYRGLPKSLIYGASKAAMINLAESLFIELKPENINVSVINPGFVKTRLTDQNDFKMPFLIDANQAASFIIKGLKAKKFEIHFPGKFTYIMKFLRIIPNWLFFKISSKLN